MDIKYNNPNINFNAKFVKSDSLKDVVNYAIEHGQFDRLNKARKELDSSYKGLRTRLKLDIYYNDDYPTVIFSRFEPKKNSLGISEKDYELTAQTEHVSSKKMNALKFALERIIKLANNAPDNKLYKKVVLEKGEIIDPFYARA